MGWIPHFHVIVNPVHLKEWTFSCLSNGPQSSLTEEEMEGFWGVVWVCFNHHMPKKLVLSHHFKTQSGSFSKITCTIS